MLHFSSIWFEGGEAGGEDAQSLSINDKLITITQEPASRRFESDASLTISRLHIKESGSALCQLRNNSARHLVWHVYYNLFKWFQFLSAFYLLQDMRLGDLELESFATHVLKENRNMKFAPAVDSHKFTGREIHFKTDINLKFTLEAFPDLSTGDKLADSAGERGIIDE